MNAEVVTIGEAMVALYPSQHTSLGEAVTFRSDVGGAEFNVATTVARLGVSSSWVSRLGADGFGDRILAAARAAGVDTCAVQRDSHRPTGVYIKETTSDASGPRTRMHYYRRGSAASALAPEHLRTPGTSGLLRNATYVHTSGITAALSGTAADAVTGLRELIGPRTTISVDLNHRAKLWHARDPEPLRVLTAHADLLFAGRDEAETFFGHSDPAQLFASHPRLGTLVIKDDSRHASVYRRPGGETRVPCLKVDVVEPIGAGDAFAAGFLAASVRGADDFSALRVGHALAALTLTVDGDRPATVPSAAELAAIAGATDEEWSTWRVTRRKLPWRDIIEWK
jgi:2-dehydro-3-deoxygluconokinase